MASIMEFFLVEDHSVSPPQVAGRLALVCSHTEQVDTAALAEEPEIVHRPDLFQVHTSSRVSLVNVSRISEVCILHHVDGKTYGLQLWNKHDSAFCR